MLPFMAACWQGEVTARSPEEHISRLEQVLGRLSGEGCRLLVLPEMWFCGFSRSDLRTLALKSPSILARWQDWCQRSSMVIVGSMPEIAGGHLFNASYVVDGNGELAGRYCKTHLFSPHGEQRVFTPGQEALVCDTQLGRLGILICYDLRFPELSRRLALKGARVLCVSALWPLARIRHWDLLLRARALENQVFVVGCNGCGADGSLLYGGGSVIAAPTGERLARGSENEEIIRATVDFETMESFRLALPCWDDRRGDLYGDLGR
ncbi:MAG: carbon-nitrogen family hydrolase [Syntrophobacteraceae bacterium]|jgi:predicted amidohydrolase|nr:carbon-nitrogen family hydrolase [Syntrophobacteraceae bacterium]